MIRPGGGVPDTRAVPAPPELTVAQPAAGPVDVAALYLEHRMVMYRAARRVLGFGRTEDVQDAVQAAVEQTAIEIAKPDFVNKTNWAGWLTTVTTRKAVDLHRHDSTRSKHERDAARQERVQPRRDPVGAGTAARADVHRLRTVMADLPGDAPLMVYLTHVEDLSNAEVGRQLGVSGQYVGRVVAKSLATLTAKMEEVNDQ